MKIINILKSNVIQLVSFVIFAVGLVLAIVSLFTPMFTIEYFQATWDAEAGQWVDLISVAKQTIGFPYVFENITGWLETGALYPYAMFIQISLMILIVLSLSIICYIVSFVFALFKENLSKKGEFAGGAFAIVSAIVGFAGIMFLVILLSTTKIGGSASFVYQSYVRTIESSYILLIIASGLFIISGAINASLISEKFDQK